jgi:serine O-acetyltransferase
MILSKSDYKIYLSADSKALGRERVAFRQRAKELFFPSYVWQFQHCLRKVEYVKNCKLNGLAGKIHYVLLYRRFCRLSLRLGFSIPPNVFGPGLAIVHYGTIVVNAKAKVGANCRLHPSTCIGASGGSDKAPQLGDNIYIGPGVKIYGNIVLGNNIAVAANTAVNRSFTEDGILIGGVPARKLKTIDISTIIKHIRTL